ncbi:MAG: anhydro-N-acetylmuramic acid kinase [Sumerlaeia bacterium]
MSLIKHLTRIIEKPHRVAIGIMSGTSVDGVDVALVRLGGCGQETCVELVAAETFPFSPSDRAAIHEAFNGSTRHICELNFRLGRIFGECSAALCFKAGIPLQDVDFVASHGQTLYHIPPGTDGIASTLQIGEAAVIAERMGCLVISDFRTRDMAAGGDGAPLVPFVDQLLFSKKGKRRGILNLGGIANLTIVDGVDPENNFAFDTGPGNMIIDAVARRINPKLTYDSGGELAAKGRVDRHLLQELIDHDYFRREPPKSTGRELFGEQYAEALLKVIPPEDWVNCLATVTALTAKSISNALADHVIPRGGSVWEILVCGGGVHNKTLMQFLVDSCPDVNFIRTNAEGIPADSKESIAFAVLGNQTLHGLCGNLPKATGAERGVILGKITFP